MPNKKNDDLFQLIKSMERSEKRNFKLYMKRVSGSENFIIMQIFDLFDKMTHYDEAILLKKIPDLKKHQLSNLKAHLMKQVLTSLRILKNKNDIIGQVNELLQHSQIFYSKGLYQSSLKILNKAKVIAQKYNLYFLILQIINFEKKIESLHITRSFENRAEILTSEALSVNQHISTQNILSNLALNMYSWYIKKGIAKNQKEIMALDYFFKTNLPQQSAESMGFYEAMYFHQAHCWFYFIKQDFLNYYKYTQKWFNLFQQQPSMQIAEPDHYIKAMHNLLNAHFNLNNAKKFDAIILHFENFASKSIIQNNSNLKVQSFIYLYTAKINHHFLRGTFSEALPLIDIINKNITEYALQLDQHRILIFYYKIACLYFGCGDYNKSIDYLNKIYNEKFDLRTDLQCYARLLQLIVHYELGNFSLLEYLLKSTYRFMAKMQHLSQVETHIFAFLKKSFALNTKQLLASFKELKSQLEKLENDPLEIRSFMYLDINAWLESKIKKIPIEQIRQQKFLALKSRSISP